MSSLIRRLRLPQLALRHLSASSAILNPTDPNTPLTSKQKSRFALSLLKSEKNPDRIVEICRAAALTPDSHLDRTAFSMAISSLSKSQSFLTIRSFLDEFLTRPDLRNERFRSHAIVLFGQAGMLDDAVRTFKASDAPTVKSLNALLFACVLAKRYDELERILRDFPSSYSITADRDTYNTVIKAFCESGSSRSVYSVLDEMDRKRIKPNLTSFSTAIAGFYQEERYDDVEKVLELMKKYDCSPEVSTYNVRIQSLCKLKKPNEGKGLLKEMLTKGPKPNWVTYNHLIFGFCAAGNLGEAKKLYREMGRRGCVPDSSLYFTLIHYLCQGGDFEAALGVCRESMKKNWVPCFKTMKTLVNGLVSGSKVEEAREIVEKIKEKFSNNAEMWKEVEEALPQ